MSHDDPVLDAYRRLRRAAEKVVDAANYAAGDEDEARVYASQLRDLKRELDGEPRPSTARSSTTAPKAGRPETADPLYRSVAMLGARSVEGPWNYGLQGLPCEPGGVQDELESRS